MKSHSDILDAYKYCCSHDDKNVRLQTLKYYEEFGEFFREYLVHCSSQEHVRAMAYRKPDVQNLIEEGFDCMIVLCRLKGKDLPNFINTSESNSSDVIDILAYSIKETSIEGIRCSLSFLCKNEKNYNEILDKKISKWEAILIKCGVLP